MRAYYALRLWRSNTGIGGNSSCCGSLLRLWKYCSSPSVMTLLPSIRPFHSPGISFIVGVLLALMVVHFLDGAATPP
jgi:hypothetical protein